VEADLRPFNLGLASGFKKAQDRTLLARTHGNGYITDKPRMMMMMMMMMMTFSGDGNK